MWMGYESLLNGADIVVDGGDDRGCLSFGHGNYGQVTRRGL